MINGSIEARTHYLWVSIVLRVGLLLVFAGGLFVVPAAAQAPFTSTQSQTAPPPALPDDLTPETVDGLLARLTDGEIRSLLRDELRARADEQAAQQSSLSTVQQAREQLAELLVGAQDNAARHWANVTNLGQYAQRSAEVLALARYGVAGMVATAAAIVAAALAAAILVRLAIKGWRTRVVSTSGSSYWDRLARTTLVTLLDILPIIAFSLMTTTLAPAFSASLGPIIRPGFSYVWIFEAGVVNAWTAVVLSRRLFAPDAPKIRIANVTDAAAIELHALVQRCALIGMGGWLCAGLWPMAGFQFSPAILTMALAGTIVFGVLLYWTLKRFDQIGDLAQHIVTAPNSPRLLFDINHQNDEEIQLSRILGLLVPWLVTAYLVFAYLYWLLLWFDSGQQHLVGPLGTLLVLLSVPALDRLGAELAAGILTAERPSTPRYRTVMHGAWRVVLSLVGLLTVAAFWGIDIVSLAKGPGAPSWASAAFDIAVTLLIGQLIWRLVQAALHQERRIAGGDMEDVLEEDTGSSRLSTLIPLFRNFLLMSLTIIVAMITLSSLGMDVGPLLASAGIIGIAIGFGAQTLVRDIFSGIFFLIDDAFRVGEYIELDTELRGEVEALSIRSLQLRHHRGPILTIPFGELKSVANHSRDWVIYKMPFRLEPHTDPALVKKIVKRIGAELMEDPEHGHKFIEPVKSQGVFSIDDDSALIMRVKFKCRPRMQFVLRREVYHRIRSAFEEADIRFARRKVEVVSPDDQSSTAAAAAAETGPQGAGQSGGRSAAADSM